MNKLSNDPFVSFQMPTVAVPGFEQDAFWAIRQAQTHGTYLTMQFYAHEILDMFNTVGDMDSIAVSLSDDGDGFIYLDSPEFQGEFDDDPEEIINEWSEKINDLRDGTMIGFIEAICSEGQWCRDDIEDTIEGAYDKLAKNDHMPTWSEVSARRKSEIEARELVDATPQPNPTKPSRRM